MHYKSLIIPLVSLATLVASGCAQIPDESASAQPVSIKQPDTPLSATDALSNGQSVTLTTSQGEIRVEPAVVSMEQTVLNGDPETLPAYYDPWEGFNRRVYRFNALADRYVLMPVVQVYRTVTPGFARSNSSATARVRSARAGEPNQNRRMSVSCAQAGSPLSSKIAASSAMPTRNAASRS